MASILKNSFHAEYIGRDEVPSELRVSELRSVKEDVNKLRHEGRYKGPTLQGLSSSHENCIPTSHDSADGNGICGWTASIPDAFRNSITMKTQACRCLGIFSKYVMFWPAYCMTDAEYSLGGWRCCLIYSLDRWTSKRTCNQLHKAWKPLRKISKCCKVSAQRKVAHSWSKLTKFVYVCYGSISTARDHMIGK